MTEDYTISDSALKHYASLASNKYRALFRLISDGLENGSSPYSAELSDVVLRSCHLFSGITEGVKSTFNNDNIIRSSPDANQILTAYSLNIAARAVSMDLETMLTQGRNRMEQHIPKLDKDSYCPGETDYFNVKLALEKMARTVRSSRDEPAQSAKDFFDNHSNITNEYLNRKPEVHKKLNGATWQIGRHEIKGMKETAPRKKSARPIAEKEKEQFRTTLKTTTIDPSKILPRERIVGDQSVIDDLYEKEDMLCMYNKQAQMNPCLEKKLYSPNILLAGLEGCGKGVVAYNAIDRFRTLTDQLGLGNLVTSFSVHTSWKHGEIQMLRSQMDDICRSDDVILIFQDELTQIVKGGDGRDNGMEDVVLELQKFLDGEYTNKGNYMFLATTNKYSEIPRAIQDRFNVINWQGAVTTDDKATLLYYKLEEGCKQGYVKISDSEFRKAGAYSHEHSISGRGMTNICSRLLKQSFQKKRLGDIWQARDDYEKQLSMIDQFRDTITYLDLMRELKSYADNKADARQNSLLYMRR